MRELVRCDEASGRGCASSIGSAAAKCRSGSLTGSGRLTNLLNRLSQKKGDGVQTTGVNSNRGLAHAEGAQGEAPGSFVCRTTDAANKPMEKRLVQTSESQPRENENAASSSTYGVGQGHSESHLSA
jgi:hypothetical protein